MPKKRNYVKTFKPTLAASTLQSSTQGKQVFVTLCDSGGKPPTRHSISSKHDMMLVLVLVLVPWIETLRMGRYANRSSTDREAVQER